MIYQAAHFNISNWQGKDNETIQVASQWQAGEIPLQMIAGISGNG
jgi:hypothetical protein